MPIRYTWDPEKNAANLRKRRISFERAVRIFNGFTLEYQDERYHYEEIRQVAIGLVEADEIVVIFADVDDEERRVISARGATRFERQVYWEARRRHD
jgi:uncharacterized DUF497 family protein